MRTPGLAVFAARARRPDDGGEMGVTRRAALGGVGLAALGATALAGCVRDQGRTALGSTTASASRGATKPADPASPLVLGSVGVSSGLESQFEKQISIAVGEARVDVNAAGGVFGRPVTMLPRRVVEGPDADLSATIAELRAAGASGVVVSCGEPSLRTAMRAFADAGIAVVSVTSTSRDLRDPEVGSSGMLIRLSPTDRCLASAFADAAQASGTSSTVAIAVLARDSMQGRSLAEELRLRVEPAGGQVSATFFPAGTPDLGDPVKAIAARPPSLVVIDAGDETPQILSALRTAVATGAQAPPVRTTFYNSGAWGERLPSTSMRQVTGTLAGAPPGSALEDMMLNIDPSLATTGYDFAGQAYDAVVLLALAARAAHSLEGARIASMLPRLLAGGEEAATYAAAAQLQDQGTAPQYVGMAGRIRLGDDGDPTVVELTSVSYDDQNRVRQLDGTTITLS